jgi:hypothetical protein
VATAVSVLDFQPLIPVRVIPVVQEVEEKPQVAEEQEPPDRAMRAETVEAMEVPTLLGLTVAAVAVAEQAVLEPTVLRLLVLFMAQAVLVALVHQIVTREHRFSTEVVRAGIPTARGRVALLDPEVVVKVEAQHKLLPQEPLIVAAEVPTAQTAVLVSSLSGG